MRSIALAADRWAGFHGARLRQSIQRPDAFAANLACARRPRASSYGLGHNTYGNRGGLAVILGGFVAIVALPMAAVLLVAVFTVHLPYGFSSIKLLAVTAAGAQFGPPGYECDLLYLACLATLVMTRSGTTRPG
jgi:putative oxidoreductase